MFGKLSALLILVAAAFSIGDANAGVTIDFNGLTDNCSNCFPPQGFAYAEDGFSLENVSGGFPFASIPPGNVYYTGTPSFFNNSPNGVTVLSKIGGGVFSLTSIDLDGLQNTPNAFVTFNGALDGGGTVSQSFTTDALIASLQTFFFNTSFTNLVSVSWAQVEPYHVFDNIVIDGGEGNGNGNSNVPEPSPLGLIAIALLSFLGVGVIRRQTRV